MKEGGKERKKRERRKKKKKKRGEKESEWVSCHKLILVRGEKMCIKRKRGLSSSSVSLLLLSISLMKKKMMKEREGEKRVHFIFIVWSYSLWLVIQRKRIPEWMSGTNIWWNTTTQSSPSSLSLLCLFNFRGKKYMRERKKRGREKERRKRHSWKKMS